MNNEKKYESELSFLALLKNPLRLFGWIHIYFVAVLIAIGIFYINSLDDISFNSVPETITEPAVIFVDIDKKEGGLKPAVDLNTVSKSSPDLIAKGKELYDANCLSCHGAEGNGDGPAGLVLNPKPRNFHDKGGWTNGRTLADMYKTLQVGILANGMAAYEYLPVDDRFAIIHYVMSFDEYPVVTDEEIALLNTTYDLSKETMVPHQVPVRVSKQILAEENEQLENVIKKINDELISSNEATVVLLKEICADVNVMVASYSDSKADNVNDFISYVSYSPVESGFKAQVVSLSNNQWKSIFDYLQNNI